VVWYAFESVDQNPRLSRFGLLLVGLLALSWGFNWPIMKVVLRDVAPLTFRGVCLMIGGLGILSIARVARHALAVPREGWGALLWLSATNVTGWNVLMIYGIAQMPSGRAALLAYTMPLWATSLSIWLLREKPTRQSLAALTLGMTGVAVLLGEDALRFGGSLGGVALMLGAAFSWGLGVVLLKRFALPVPTVTLTGWMMLVGGFPITIAAVLLEPGAWRPVGVYPALGVAYNVLVAFMFCYWAWNRVVLMVPVAVSSLTSLITPIVGILSGMLLLRERPSWRDLGAGVLIIGAVALALSVPTPPGRKAVSGST
jgi:drug/metabolite transporter (DMT)-like permease